MATVSIRDAREQAAEYLGFVASEKLTAENGEVFEIPFPSLLDDEQQERYDDLQFEMRSLDKDDDGEPLEPHSIDGKRLPPYDIRLAKAIFGEDGYARFKAAGGRSSDVSLIWWKMRQQLSDRKGADSKSAGSTGGVDIPGGAD
ncbi:hypothetical protein E2F47_22260 [Mycobacterium eburneum]|nr:hypothetical protein [Mycobacterium eburneum]TDH48892.1 hypothetical protein E2F47_22260 [Mycobacterium eburneum]